MDFTKSKEKDKQIKSVDQVDDDKYIQEMKTRLLIKKQKGAMGEETLGNFYITNEQDTDKQIRFRLEYSINLWSVLLIAAFISRSIYPFSVRFVKSKFKMEGFLNVHMAILPFIFMSNAVVLGIYEGFWGKYWFQKEIDSRKNKQIHL